MEILIVNFSLQDMDESQYLELCEQLAPAVTEVEGLTSKVWLANPDTNTYGGVYTFESADAVEQFLGSELFADVGRHPNLKDPGVTRFHVLEDPTRTTHGLAASRA